MSTFSPVRIKIIGRDVQSPDGSFHYDLRVVDATTGLMLDNIVAVDFPEGLTAENSLMPIVRLTVVWPELDLEAGITPEAAEVVTREVPGATVRSVPGLRRTSSVPLSQGLAEDAARRGEGSGHSVPDGAVQDAGLRVIPG
jgi:hypothetical protein